MTTLYFDENDRLDTILSRVRESSDGELTLFIPETSVFYQNEVNKKILQKIAMESGKTLKFGDEKTQNEVGPGEEASTETKRPETQSAESTSQKTKRSKRLSGFKLFIILIGIFGVFTVAAAAFTLLYLPKATVILFVEEKILQKGETIEVSPDISEINLSEKKIPGKVIAVTEEEKKSFSATGKKVVGEKATGTVILQNWTDEETLLPAGTKLTVAKGEDGAGFSFTINSGVSVPAQTFSIPAPGQKLYEAGTAQVSVTAEDIGEKYNLSADTNFSVAGFAYADFSAVNETAFSGGLTRDVIVVSQEDQDKAQQELKSKLLAQGREDLTSKVLGDQKLLAEVVAGDVLGVDFSHEIGEEAASFEVLLKTQSTATVYSESKLKELAEKILAESVPEGYEISSKDLGVSIDLTERQSGGGLKLTGSFKTLVIPAFDEENLVEKLSGNRAQVAGSILDELPNIQGYEISFWPRLPVFLQIIPLRYERLTIEVEAK